MYVHTYISTDGSNHLVVVIFSLQGDKAKCFATSLSDGSIWYNCVGFLKISLPTSLLTEACEGNQNKEESWGDFSN